MNLRVLKTRIASGDTPCIELHAIEQIMYIPYERVDDVLKPLTDGRARTLQFRDRYRACLALAATGLSQLEFVHRSSYGEMIGAEGGMAQTEMRQLIDLSRLL